MMSQKLCSGGRPVISARPVPASRTCTVVVRAVASQNRVETPARLNRDPADNWAPASWRALPAQQQPTYSIASKKEDALAVIARMPPLIFAGEARLLQSRLAMAATGDAFLLFGGDCAESFDQFSANRIRDTYRVLLQMSVVLAFGGGVPIVKLGRIAGQFAKPRSANTETINGVTLPAYRGDIINGPEFTESARIPDPFRLVQAYNQSAATLNLLRGFSSGGYAGLDRVSAWNLDFMANSDEGKAYMDIAKRVDEAIGFMRACGVDPKSAAFKETEFYTCHECLLLEYEEALTRLDSTTDSWYDCSAHFLWCGERTRQLDHAHVEFLRGVRNPIGVKVSDKMEPAEIVSLVSTLNPTNEAGRLAIIVRMGPAKVRTALPTLIKAINDAGLSVTWVCDPMHGNTETVAGYKTRRYDNIRAEIEAFFDVHEQMGTVPGGVHLEMTGDNVTECMGGGASVGEADLNSRYHTHCDPRLNAEQSLELSFYLAGRLRQRRETMAKSA